MVKSLILIAAFGIMTACTSIPAYQSSDPREIWCDHNQPRRDATPVTPRAELDRINAHNRKGARWCGWTS
jgi:hypothetical protein